MARTKKIIVRTLTYAALVTLGTIFTLPFFWLLSTSFKPASRIQKWPPDILPMQPAHVRVDGKVAELYQDKSGAVFAVVERLSGGVAMAKPAKNLGSRPTRIQLDDCEPVVKPGLEWSNYTRGLVFIPFFQQLRNTVVIALMSVLGTIVSCSLVAYGLSKIEWKGRNALFLVLLATMMLPAQVTMIPVFTIFVKLRWVNTFLPLIVPSFLGSAFFIFLLRQFFMGIPRELSEAARIDGCSEFGIYRRIIMPLSKPALATVGLFTFMGAWNDFLNPLIYLLDEQKYTLSLGLAMFTGQYGNEYGMLMAVSAVFTLPIIVLFFFTQRTFIQGMTMSGIKG